MLILEEAYPVAMAVDSDRYLWVVLRHCLNRLNMDKLYLDLQYMGCVRSWIGLVNERKYVLFS